MLDAPDVPQLTSASGIVQSWILTARRHLEPMVALVGAGVCPRGNIPSRRHQEEGHVLTHTGFSGPWTAAWHLVGKMTQGPFFSHWALRLFAPV